MLSDIQHWNFHYLPPCRVFGQSVVRPETLQGFYSSFFSLLLHKEYPQSLGCVEHSRERFSDLAAILNFLANCSGIYYQANDR